MVNINNVAISMTFFTFFLKNQLNFVNVLIKRHPTTDQDGGNKPMLVQSFHEHYLLSLIPMSQTCFGKKSAEHLGMTPNVFNSDKKTKCNIGRIICVACIFHLR